MILCIKVSSVTLQSLGKQFKWPSSFFFLMNSIFNDVGMDRTDTSDMKKGDKTEVKKEESEWQEKQINK